MSNKILSPAELYEKMQELFQCVIINYGAGSERVALSGDLNAVATVYMVCENDVSQVFDLVKYAEHKGLTWNQFADWFCEK
jgi:hypothetical protein